MSVPKFWPALAPMFPVPIIFEFATIGARLVTPWIPNCNELRLFTGRGELSIEALNRLGRKVELPVVSGSLESGDESLDTNNRPTEALNCINVELLRRWRGEGVRIIALGKLSRHIGHLSMPLSSTASRHC